MRTNIVIDDNLMNQALAVSGCKTKKETVEAGLKLLLAQRNQSKIRNLRGKLNWEGDLDQMRTDK
ncbi:MAG: type II toxin-antitoxin system VapB family antitoxin [Spirochaetia bacterium]|nr:type II toxin-antitoxin system VapB family antitoxin [Spirochaetia bacterium]